LGAADSIPGLVEDNLAANGGEKLTSGDDRRERVLRFTERFGSVLVDSGLPRMPAWIFAALLATDSASLTSAELCELLQVSPAAISGGARYLIGVGMLRREGQPGSSRHHYRIPEGVWDDVMGDRNRVLERYTASFREGVELLGADTPAGARMAESVDYFEFVSAELPAILAKWQAHKALVKGASATQDGRSAPERR
jgi:hypothetical protein